MPFASSTATRPNPSQSATKQAWLKSEDQFSEALSNATNSLPVTGDDTGKNTLREGMRHLKDLKTHMARLTDADSKHDVVSLALPLFAISNATEWLLAPGDPFTTSPLGSGKPDLAEAFSALRTAVTIGWLSKYGESVLDPSRSLKDPLHVDDMALQSLIDCATREDGESTVLLSGPPHYKVHRLCISLGETSLRYQLVPCTHESSPGYIRTRLGNFGRW